MPRAVVPVLLALLALFFVCGATAERFYVLHRGGHKQFEVVAESKVAPESRCTGFDFNGLRNDVILIGEYNDTMLKTGWDQLKIVTNDAYNDTYQAYAAGFFEGKVTAHKIWQYHANSFPKPMNSAVSDYFAKHIQWMDVQVANSSNNDPFWVHVALMWEQWNGMFDGVNQAAKPGENMTKLMLIRQTSMGDLFDLQAALDPSSDQARDLTKMTKPEFERWFVRNTHCSALYKLTADLQEIFFGHVSWFDYTHAYRIFKHMTLNFRAAGTTAKTISFSSYPGVVSSFDDYYVTDSGLVAIETSFSVFNRSIYIGNIYPQSLLYWMRIMVANRMATSAPQWTELMAKYNSGTYNNQWTVLDMKLFEPGKGLKPNTLWVAEQLPGIVKSQDVTDMLRYGYYPQYNVPMNHEMWLLAGYETVHTQFDDHMLGYQTCVRAQIFRRDQTKVKDMESFKFMMQYNDYENDPISDGNPCYAISCRSDLDMTKPSCSGAYDAKLSSYSLWKKGQTVLTYSGVTPQQPQFAFNTTRAKCPAHVGVPEVFDFTWQEQQP